MDPAKALFEAHAIRQFMVRNPTESVIQAVNQTRSRVDAEWGAFWQVLKDRYSWDTDLQRLQLQPANAVTVQ